jgi:hypothetical protein
MQFSVVEHFIIHNEKQSNWSERYKGSKLTLISIILLNARVTFIKSNKRNKPKLCKRVTPHCKEIGVCTQISAGEE